MYKRQFLGGEINVPVKSELIATDQGSYELLGEQSDSGSLSSSTLGFPELEGGLSQVTEYSFDPFLHPEFKLLEEELHWLHGYLGSRGVHLSPEDLGPP